MLSSFQGPGLGVLLRRSLEKRTFASAKGGCCFFALTLCSGAELGCCVFPPSALISLHSASSSPSLLAPPNPLQVPVPALLLMALKAVSLSVAFGPNLGGYLSK